MLFTFKDNLSDELSYMDVDADTSLAVLRVAESLDGDITGFGWQMLKNKYNEKPKNFKPHGPSGKRPNHASRVSVTSYTDTVIRR